MRHRSPASEADDLDSNTWDKLRQMQEQFLESRKKAAQAGQGDAIEMTDSGGPGALEQSFRNRGLDPDEIDDAPELPETGHMGLLGVPQGVGSHPGPQSLLGQGMALKGRAQPGGRPYRIEMHRSPNPKSPTGYSWAVRQVYDDGRP
jgi:hypothetical protein